MSKHIEVAVSPFYNGRGWTDHGTGINFEKTTLLKGHRIDLKEDTNLRGIRNSIRLNHLLLLEGELPEMGEVRPEDANPAELTHKEYTTLLEELKSGGGDNSKLESELESTKAELATANEQNAQLQADIKSLEAQLADLQSVSDEGVEVQSLGYTKEELESKTVAELQGLAKDEGIELTATKKADIIQEILDAQ